MLMPVWADGTFALLVSLFLVNLLVLLEVADRLSLKGELEVAREIQLAMLPRGTYAVGDIEICGMTRPANTVGGDFYDVLPLPDGRVILTLGDVAGKGSPAALLMALLLASLRTLVDERLDPSSLVARLNVADLAAQPGVPIHHALLFGVRPGDRRPLICQRRTEPAADSPPARPIRAPSRHRRRAGHVRSLHVRPRAKPVSSPATCSFSTATGSPKPKTQRATA